MREPGRTGSHSLPQQHAPTLEVIDYIITETCDPETHEPHWSPEPPLISTVTVAPWTNPVEPPNPSLVSYLKPPSPELVIVEQPKQRGMRFRYQCEGRSAGSILGENSSDHSKTLPAIGVVNASGLHDVHVIVCLVWKDPPYRIHPHSLVGKDCHDGICEIILHPDEGLTEHSFSNLGIQCIRKKEIESSVKARLKLGIDPYNAGMWRHHEEVDLNVVRLCFQAWYISSMGQRNYISPVLSEPVYDKKSTNTSELKICRMNKDSGRCEGGDEIYILCDKVQKEDIQVMFVDSTWEARADFSQADVHRQIAIVLKTPPYHDLHITDPACVQVCLQRITDGIRSEGLVFTYMPRHNNSYSLHKKRPRLSCPLDEFNGPDPHGIELKRKQARPDYMNHCTSNADFGMTLPDPFPPFDYLSGVNLTAADPALDDAPPFEEMPSNLEVLMSWIPQEVDDIAAPCHFENFAPCTEDEATASLVGFSLALTGEQERRFSDCSYPEDTQMGGC
ncbi:transcription factor RelB isoform X2 [Pseudophryne corroboree]|uniref:transcription factor RelB isoform X2 n=1 Tax=Pseudophryne corroboree TaxID=495146 RepID=UPI0030821B9A